LKADSIFGPSIPVGRRWLLPGGRCPAGHRRVPAAAHRSFPDGAQECAGQGERLIECWRRPGGIGRHLWVAAPPHSTAPASVSRSAFWRPSNRTS